MKKALRLGIENFHLWSGEHLAVSHGGRYNEALRALLRKISNCVVPRDAGGEIYFQEVLRAFAIKVY